MIDNRRYIGYLVGCRGMSAAVSFEIDLGGLRSWFGIGVAGNFAGHLEQPVRRTTS